MSYEKFKNAEEAWFWFVKDISRTDTSLNPESSLERRAITSQEFLSILNRLYKNRVITYDHLLVMRCYGRLGIPPNPSILKQERAHKLWQEGIKRVHDALYTRGLLHDSPKPRKKRRQQVADRYVLSLMRGYTIKVN